MNSTDLLEPNTIKQTSLSLAVDNLKTGMSKTQLRTKKLENETVDHARDIKKLKQQYERLNHLNINNYLQEIDSEIRTLHNRLHLYILKENIVTQVRLLVLCPAFINKNKEYGTIVQPLIHIMIQAMDLKDDFWWHSKRELSISSWVDVFYSLLKNDELS